jgi:hypothetical protein
MLTPASLTPTWQAPYSTRITKSHHLSTTRCFSRTSISTMSRIPSRLSRQISNIPLLASGSGSASVTTVRRRACLFLQVHPHRRSHRRPPRMSGAMLPQIGRFSSVRSRLHCRASFSDFRLHLVDLALLPGHCLYITSIFSVPLLAPFNSIKTRYHKIKDTSLYGLPHTPR